MYWILKFPFIQRTFLPAVHPCPSSANPIRRSHAASARAKVLLEDLPNQRPRVQFVVALVQINSHLGRD